MPLIDLLNLRFNAHLGLLSFLELLLHLLLVGSRHYIVLPLILLLSHPLLIRLRIVAARSELVLSLLVYDFLFFDVAQLGDVVGFIELFLDEPRFHLPNSVVVDELLVLGILEELRPQFALLLIDQLLAESLLRVFGSDPLLECRRVPIRVGCASRTL